MVARAIGPCWGVKRRLVVINSVAADMNRRVEWCARNCWCHAQQRVITQPVAERDDVDTARTSHPAPPICTISKACSVERDHRAACHRARGWRDMKNIWNSVEREW
eukprot:974026-Prymnesium_polylepis.2